MSKKNAEWEKLASSYNSKTTHILRNAENLKAAWESMKKLARKIHANSRMEISNTGGGPPVKEDNFHKHVIELLETSAVGPIDSNREALQTLEVTTGKDVTSDDNIVSLVIIKEEVKQDDNVQVDLANGDWTSSSSQPLDIPLAAALRSPIVEVNNFTDEQQLDIPLAAALQSPIVEVNNFTDEQQLDIPLAATLRSSTVKDNNFTDEPVPLTSSSLRKRKQWSCRRRPLPFSGNSLQKLHEKKMAAIQQQMELAMQEREEAKKLIELDIKIKEEILKIKEEILKQEKLKTRMLLREMRKKM